MNVLFLKSLIFVNIVIVTNQVSLKRYFLLMDFRVPVFSSVLCGIENSLHCCLQCEKNINCTAVNYNTDEKICELIDPGVTAISPTKSPGWTFYYSNSIHLNPLSSATATQSSVIWGGSAEKAIDGGKMSNWGSWSCMCTGITRPNQWWLGDFTVVFKIHGVTLWNRLDCCYYRLSNIVIFVSPSLTGIDDPSNVCGTFDGPPNPWDTNPITINCTQPLRGRYVKIVKQKLDYLSFCEVELILAR